MIIKKREGRGVQEQSLELANREAWRKCPACAKVETRLSSLYKNNHSFIIAAEKSQPLHRGSICIKIKARGRGRQSACA